MFRFFRQLRHKLLTENRFSKYMLYAIGEIVLVVIGILIALEINNWNQQRILQADQKKVLLNLYEEFMLNRNLLDASIANNRKTVNSNIFLFSLMGADRQELKKTNIDSLLSSIFIADEFIPSVNSVQDILQSGRLNLLDDQELSNLLSNWINIIAIYEDRDKTLDDWTYNHTITYLNKYISFKQVDLYGNYDWAGESKLKKDYYSLFQELEFENIIESQVFFTSECLNRLQQADSILEKLIEKTKPANKRI